MRLRKKRWITAIVAACCLPFALSLATGCGAKGTSSGEGNEPFGEMNPDYQDIPCPESGSFFYLNLDFNYMLPGAKGDDYVIIESMAGSEPMLLEVQGNKWVGEDVITVVIDDCAVIGNGTITVKVEGECNNGFVDLTVTQFTPKDFHLEYTDPTSGEVYDVETHPVESYIFEGEMHFNMDEVGSQGSGSYALDMGDDRGTTTGTLEQATE